ncbi:hypothetical protein DFJ58DRAFT_909969 [Suillus subalutaceus]|uniref:uncharacterized protein n=1 Tax=Suillus subalutaceus TaxID=48586 RepID=UPI001B87C0AE|nr:uncharacterized protein DFJ58DRAFT_909969 [Suillus subalutaceus]KAG1875468.1 hypothetical protein DFJ58DRAFT_909969 [Suillus subalutaceus]
MLRSKVKGGWMSRMCGEEYDAQRCTKAIGEYQSLEKRAVLCLNLLNLVQTFTITSGLLISSLIVASYITRGQSDASDSEVFITYYAQTTYPSPTTTKLLHCTTSPSKSPAADALPSSAKADQEKCPRVRVRVWPLITGGLPVQLPTFHSFVLFSSISFHHSEPFFLVYFLPSSTPSLILVPSGVVRICSSHHWRLLESRGGVDGGLDGAGGVDACMFMGIPFTGRRKFAFQAVQGRRVGSGRTVASCTESVDFHWHLLGDPTMDGGYAERTESDRDKSDGEDDKTDGSAEEETVQDENIIAAQSSLLPGASIFRLHCGSLPAPNRLVSLCGFSVFLSSESKKPAPPSSIFICTSVACRGLDLPLVRALKYDLPIECGAATYVHRVGHTSYAGKGGKAWSIVAHSE